MLERAVEKFKEAVTIKRNHHYALFNWAEALREWSRLTTGKKKAKIRENKKKKLTQKKGGGGGEWWGNR